MNKILIVILLFFLFLSCGRNNKIVDSGKLSTSEFWQQVTTSIANMGFYTSPMQKDSSYVCLYVNNMEYDYSFYSDTLNSLYICKTKLDGYQVEKFNNTLLTENQWCYLTIDTTSIQQIEIDNKPYIYLSYAEKGMGNAILETYVTFSLIDINDFANYKLVYEGRYSFKCEDCIDGFFLENRSLEKHPLILAKLKGLSNISKLIYHPTEEEHDIYHYMNYEEKWNGDNNARNVYGAGYSEIETPIKSTYYNTNLFDLNKGGEGAVTENDKYILKTYFRGNIIGYNKNMGRYFPLLIESCMHFCDKEIELFDQDSLRISYTEGGGSSVYHISMGDLIFDDNTGT